MPQEIARYQEKKYKFSSCETCLHWSWSLGRRFKCFPSLTEQGDLPHNQRNSKWIRAIKLSCPPAPSGRRLRGWHGFWQWAVYNPWQRLHTNMNHVVLKRSKWVYSGLLTFPAAGGDGALDLKQVDKTAIESIAENNRFNPVSSSELHWLRELLVPFFPLRDSPRMLLLRKTYVKPAHCVNLTSVSGFPSTAWDSCLSLRCKNSSLQIGEPCKWKDKEKWIFSIASRDIASWFFLATERLFPLPYLFPATMCLHTWKYSLGIKDWDLFKLYKNSWHELWAFWQTLKKLIHI